MILVEIPVLPHVKSLLLSLYGQEPIKAHGKNLVGKEIQNILIPYAQAQMFQQKLIGEKISILVSDQLAMYYLNFQRVYDLGCYFENQFHDFMFTYVDAQVECGRSIQSAIRSFYSKYNIDEEMYEMDSAQKSYRRRRDKLKAMVSP